LQVGPGALAEGAAARAVGEDAAVKGEVVEVMAGATAIKHSTKFHS